MATAGPAADQWITALCLWREARGGGVAEMTAVAWVIHNRVIYRRSDYTTQVLAKWQFSSMSAPGDPQLWKFPEENDASGKIAWDVAQKVIAVRISDPTGGADLYYDDALEAHPPSWSEPQYATPTVKIGRLNFFRSKEQ